MVSAPNTRPQRRSPFPRRGATLGLSAAGLAAAAASGSLVARGGAPLAPAGYAED